MANPSNVPTMLVTTGTVPVNEKSPSVSKNVPVSIVVVITALICAGSKQAPLLNSGLHPVVTFQVCVGVVSACAVDASPSKATKAIVFSMLPHPPAEFYTLPDFPYKVCESHNCNGYRCTNESKQKAI